MGFFSGEQAIFFTGREELFIGETAMYIAFIHPKISAISKIFWQRTDKQGCIHTIDTNDGKYTGSTTTFPSPTLYIHFVRKEDEGTYQLFVNTFRKIIQKSVSLVVKEGGKLFCFFEPMFTGHYIDTINIYLTNCINYFVFIRPVT